MGKDRRSTETSARLPDDRAGTINPALLALPDEAQRLLDQARVEMEQAVGKDMTRVGGLLAGRLESLSQRLAQTRAEIDRLQAQTRDIQKDPVNDLLRMARDRLQGV